jgi:hypothetical protein
MSAKRRSEFFRWVHLVHLAEEMQTIVAEGRASPDEIDVILGSVDEAFRDLVDPIEEFPSYALVKFCRELRKALVSCKVPASSDLPE